MSRTFYFGLNVKFGDVARELLSDFLAQLNTMNKTRLIALHDCCDCFRDKRLIGGSEAGSTTWRQRR